jgi:hypothetical protein
MPVQELTVRAYDHDAIVKGCLAESGVPFVDTTHDSNPMFCCSLAKRFEIIGLKINGVIKQSFMDKFCEPPVGAGPETPYPRRITGYKGFGKDNELGTVGSGLGYQGNGIIDR